jgi:hypothetical protein
MQWLVYNSAFAIPKGSRCYLSFSGILFNNHTTTTISTTDILGRTPYLP